MNSLYETSSKMTLGEYMHRSSHPQETSSNMTLGEYMYGSRHKEVLAYNRLRYGTWNPRNFSMGGYSDEYQPQHHENDDELHTRGDFRNYDTNIISEFVVSYPTHDHLTDYLPIQKDESCVRDDIHSDNDDLEEHIYTEDTIVESDDLETVDVHNEIPSNHSHNEIPISHLVADNDEATFHDIVAPLSSCFTNPSSDFQNVDVIVEHIDIGQITSADDFEPLSVCLDHFANSDDPMIIDIVNALCPPMITQGNSTTEVISADLEPDLGVTYESLDEGIDHCAEFDDSSPFYIVNTLLPMIFNEDNVSNECISADLEPDIERVSQMRTNMFVFHESDILILTKDCFLLRMDLHVCFEVYSVCRFILAADLICWIDPQLFRLYIYAWQFSLVYQHRD